MVRNVLDLDSLDNNWRLAPRNDALGRKYRFNDFDLNSPVCRYVTQVCCAPAGRLGSRWGERTQSGAGQGDGEILHSRDSKRQRLLKPEYQAAPVIAKRRFRPSYCGAESDPVGQDRGQFLYPGAVFMIEASLFGAVQVDNRDDLAFADHGNDQLRIGIAIAGDVPRKRVDILDQLSFALGSSYPANAATERYPDAGRTAHERTEHQLTIDKAIKTRPVQVRKKVPQQGRAIRHIGDGIRLAGRQGVRSVAKLPVYFGLGAIGIWTKIKHARDLGGAARDARGVAGQALLA